MIKKMAATQMSAANTIEYQLVTNFYLQIS